MSGEKSSVNWGMICHVAGLSSYIGLPVVGPLIVWLYKRKTDAYADKEGRESLNFNMSFTIYFFIAGLLCGIVVGYVLLPFILIAHIGLIIWATLKANKGESVRYPLTLRFIR
jgi:uncharacterized protein